MCKEKEELIFEEISEEEMFSDYTGGCSGDVSDCCTRVCTNDCKVPSNEQEWGKFLEVQGGVIQY